MTLEEVNNPKFKYLSHFTNNPQDGRYYLVKNEDFIVLVNVTSITRNNVYTKTIQVLYQKDPFFIHFSKIKIIDISKINTKQFKNKLGMFCLSKQHFPELYL